MSKLLKIAKKTNNSGILQAIYSSLIFATFLSYFFMIVGIIADTLSPESPIGSELLTPLNFIVPLAATSMISVLLREL